MRFGDSRRSYLTVQVSPLDFFDDDPTAYTPSSSVVYPDGGNAGTFDFFSDNNVASFQQDYVPLHSDSESDDVVSSGDDFDISAEVFACDQFRMFEFKVKKCLSCKVHDWTECPYAHKGEKARRRDPLKYRYSATPCSEIRKAGRCPEGNSCEFAHGVFETWLHPERYRTRPCRDGTTCTRRVCFFAHTADQFRVILDTGESCVRSPALPWKNSFSGDDLDDVKVKVVRPRLSPTSLLQSQMSTTSSPPVLPNSLNGITLSMQNLWIENLRRSSSCMGSPRGPQMASRQSAATPSAQTPFGSGSCAFDLWDKAYYDVEEEPVMERVESGRDLRARMYAKLIPQNSFHHSSTPVPDFGWISQLLD
ncbi:OLC1v1019373C1 [Oldenlandia corymbosa var. corymbosa]|uniref:OLC1v1019373C1 n=1 Tax=Oldenlandia corymbosa var. corymbosa TaxID=529605 RepID=A0AAV1EDT4_OLDCO|nr:OLC1v1019373C1 [Oldenlandia corymbosa var. corymbosa]